MKYAARSHLLQTDWHASLPFMQPINIFSGISTIPQPRSNTERQCPSTSPWKGFYHRPAAGSLITGKLHRLKFVSHVSDKIKEVWTSDQSGSSITVNHVGESNNTSHHPPSSLHDLATDYSFNKHIQSLHTIQLGSVIKY